MDATDEGATDEGAADEGAADVRSVVVCVGTVAVASGGDTNLVPHIPQKRLSSEFSFPHRGQRTKSSSSYVYSLRYLLDSMQEGASGCGENTLRIRRHSHKVSNQKQNLNLRVEGRRVEVQPIPGRSANMPERRDCKVPERFEEQIVP